MSFCWSSGFGILMCHLSHRGQVAHLLSGLSVFFLFIVSLFFNHEFGVIDTPIGARVFVRQMIICSTKTHLARPLGRVSEKKVRLPKVFQFGGKVRAALFVGKTFVFNREPRRGSPRKPLYIAVFVQLFICVVTHLLTCNCISE